MTDSETSRVRVCEWIWLFPICAKRNTNHACIRPVHVGGMCRCSCGAEVPKGPLP